VAGQYILHYDSAASYTALSVKQFLAKKSNILALEHPLSLPNLAVCELFTFQKQNSLWKGLLLNHWKTLIGMWWQFWKDFGKWFSAMHSGVSGTFECVQKVRSRVGTLKVTVVTNDSWPSICLYIPVYGGGGGRVLSSPSHVYTSSVLLNSINFREHCTTKWSVLYSSDLLGRGLILRTSICEVRHLR